MNINAKCVFVSVVVGAIAFASSALGQDSRVKIITNTSLTEGQTIFAVARHMDAQLATAKVEWIYGFEPADNHPPISDSDALDHFAGLDTDELNRTIFLTQAPAGRHTLKASMEGLTPVETVIEVSGVQSSVIPQLSSPGIETEGLPGQPERAEQPVSQNVQEFQARVINDISSQTRLDLVFRDLDFDDRRLLVADALDRLANGTFQSVEDLNAKYRELMTPIFGRNSVAQTTNERWNQLFNNYAPDAANTHGIPSSRPEEVQHYYGYIAEALRSEELSDEATAAKVVRFLSENDLTVVPSGSNGETQYRRRRNHRMLFFLHR